MQAWVRIFGTALAIGWCAGCTPSTPSLPSHPAADGGLSSGAKDPCGDGYALCQNRCCPDGTQCVAGECKWPYSSSRLFVYLCPDFDKANCNTGEFFQLDQMCSPFGADAIGGTCYDTGLEVSADRSYGLATCQMCGTNCSSPASFNTPHGFLGRDWYSGFAYWCKQKCSAPPDCGGRSASGSSSGGGGSSSSGSGSSSSGSGSGTISGSSDGGSADGGVIPQPGDAGDDAAASGGPGLCATSAAGKCVKCSGVNDPACGAETCCSLDNLAFCTDIGVAACIGCMSDSECDPGVPCCH